MNVKSFNLSVQGASHIRKNKECQDASVSYWDENYAIAVVCDGHGGDDYVRSAYGSQFGVKVAETNIKNFINNISTDELNKNSKMLIKQLEASIINDWNEAIYKHYEENPFTEKELSLISEKAKRKYLDDKRIESAYGTTMIAVAVTKKFWIGIQIGDGKCVAVNPQGKFLQPIPWDNKCFLNATTSICDSHALDNFRYFYSEKLPIAVFVGTDGIDDSFKNNEQLNNLYKTVLYSFMTMDFDKTIEDLEDYLPRLSAKGSGDDVSISAVIDFDKISDIDEVREFDREKEKAKVEQNQKAEMQNNEDETGLIKLEDNVDAESEAAAESEVEEAEIVGIVETNFEVENEIDTTISYDGECVDADGVDGNMQIDTVNVEGSEQPILLIEVKEGSVVLTDDTQQDE